MKERAMDTLIDSSTLILAVLVMLLIVGMKHWICSETLKGRSYYYSLRAIAMKNKQVPNHANMSIVSWSFVG